MNKIKLNVQSIFHSIDGEINGFQGAGQPCTFIRLKGCNLRCSFCDTQYSQESEPTNWMTIEEVIEQIKYPKVTITGGEPLLQKDGVFEFCNEIYLRQFFYKTNVSQISVETNGTIIPDFTIWDWVRVVMDWKLPSSGMQHKMNLVAFNWLRPQDIIKFVISDWDDYNRAIEVIKENPKWQARKVFSPAITIVHPTIVCRGYTNIEPTVDIEWPRQLLERILSDGLNIQFSLQIHKIVWPGATSER